MVRPKGRLVSFLTSLILLFVCGADASSASSQADLLIVAGQSNAVGFGLRPMDAPVGLRQSHPDVQIWTGQRFQPLVIGANTGSPGRPEAWGPEVQFAHRWRAAHPGRTLYIVKFARGSSSLAPSPGYDWHPRSEELFRSATDEVRAAKARLRGEGIVPRVNAILWVQGETDATNPRFSAAYKQHLSQFLEAMQSRWADRTTRIVIAQIAKSLPYADMVRSAQVSLAKSLPRVSAVDMDELPTQLDGLHLSAGGQVALGDILYESAAR